MDYMRTIASAGGIGRRVERSRPVPRRRWGEQCGRAIQVGAPYILVWRPLCPTLQGDLLDARLLLDLILGSRRWGQPFRAVFAARAGPPAVASGWKADMGIGGCGD